MNPRIASIENLIASDPGDRNIFGLVVADQLRLAAQSLCLARRVAIVSGFYIPEAKASETDGPPGAKVLGEALKLLGIEVDYITDAPNARLFRSLGISPVDVGTTFTPADAADYLEKTRPTHLVSIERLGRGSDGRYRNMRGIDITGVTAPLDELFLEGTRRGLTTIGIGDGGNEIGMGKVFARATEDIPHGQAIATTVTTDFCIAAGVSNWGAYGLTGALSVLKGQDLLPSAETIACDFERIIREGGAVDGVTRRHEPTVDGLELSASLRMLESIRRQIIPSPLEQGRPLLVGILGYGETGRAAAALLARCGHRVRISDEGPVTIRPGTAAAGVEAGKHSIGFLADCDLVVTSPGVSTDRPILGELHRRGIPVMSELELAYQLSMSSPNRLPAGRNRERQPAEDSPPSRGQDTIPTCREPAPTRAFPPRPFRLIAVTGTVGKRTTVELLQQLFHLTGRPLTIGGNRGKPLSELLLEHDAAAPIAVAVSSFQLESVVHFRPDIAILLNVDEAHMDRHRSIAEYVRIKSRVFMNHRPEDVLILPFDDERLRTLTRKHRGRTLFLSSQQAVDRGAWLADGVLTINVDGCQEIIGPADPPFAENLLATALTARLCGIPTDRIAQAVRQLHMENDPRLYKSKRGRVQD